MEDLQKVHALRAAGLGQTAIAAILNTEPDDIADAIAGVDAELESGGGDTPTGGGLPAGDKLIRGWIYVSAVDGAEAADEESGFTVNGISTGLSTVLFDEEFSSRPTVSVTPMSGSGAPQTAQVNYPLVDEVNVELYNAAGALVDGWVSFIAVGPVSAE